MSCVPTWDVGGFWDHGWEGCVYGYGSFRACLSDGKFHYTGLSYYLCRLWFWQCLYYGCYISWVNCYITFEMGYSGVAEDISKIFGLLKAQVSFLLCRNSVVWFLHKTSQFCLAISVINWSCEW